MPNNATLVAAIEASVAIENLGEDAPLRERALAAMCSASNSWCTTNEDEQFKAALSAIVDTARVEEVDLLKKEIEQITKINSMVTAMIAGIPVDWEQMDKPESSERFVGLMALWREVKR